MFAVLLFDGSLSKGTIGEGDVGNASSPTIFVEDDLNIIVTNLSKEKQQIGLLYTQMNKGERERERERERAGKSKKN